METRPYPLSQSTLAADREAIKALALLIDYQPINPAYSREALLLLEQTLAEAELAEARLDESFEQAQRARDEGRAVRKNTAMMRHNAVLGFKDQVIAQYGKDSYAVKAIGLVRTSDRKRPNRKKAAAQ